MEQVAKLSLEKEEMEHLVERLQDETGKRKMNQIRSILKIFFRNNWRLCCHVPASEAAA